MTILLSSDEINGIQYAQEWLDFNEIPYESRSFWNPAQGCYCLWPDIEHSIVISNQGILRNDSAQSLLAQQSLLIEFCQRGNQLWLLGTDLGLDLVFDSGLAWLRDMDQKLPPSSLILLLDSQPTDDCYLLEFCNIKAQVMKVNQFVRGSPRCQAPSLKKTRARYDYLLTTIRRPERPHRETLCDEILQRPGLVDRGLISHSSLNLLLDLPDHDRPWLGRTPHQHQSWKVHPSMDLYLDCYLEIVPETCSHDLYYFTEKTQKPIMTRTPFLMVASKGYLGWLRNRGFRTFHGLIDESYDDHPRMEDRVKHLVNVLEHIVSSGAADFYRASQDILDHNFARLCEMSGSWHHQFDQEMWQLLEEFQAQSA